MTATIAGFVTRAEAGLRGPTTVSKNITPAKGGVAPHYGGPAQACAQDGADHALCVSTWRAWQTYHMRTKGWADIAYTGAVCNHGYAFAGRGVGVRTAANGTNYGNQNFYAIVWLGGEGQAPTQAAYDAMDWWIVELRKSGAGIAVWPHRKFKSTGCPGDPLVAYAATRDGVRDLGQAGPIPIMKWVEESPTGLLRIGVFGPRTSRVQEKVGATVDGYYGENTAAKVREYQQRHGLGVDGIVGPETWGHIVGETLPPTPPPPPPPPPAPPQAPPFPLGRNQYFGPRDPKSNVNSVSGYYSHKADLHRWQAQMQRRGWSISPDGLYGPKTREVALAFQREKRLAADGLIGPATWAAAWTAPVS